MAITWDLFSVQVFFLILPLARLAWRCGSLRTLFSRRPPHSRQEYRIVARWLTRKPFVFEVRSLAGIAQSDGRDHKPLGALAYVRLNGLHTVRRSPRGPFSGDC